MPVKTISLFRGKSKSIFFRLCTRAPRILISPLFAAAAGFDVLMTITYRSVFTLKIFCKVESSLQTKGLYKQDKRNDITAVKRSQPSNNNLTCQNLASEYEGQSMSNYLTHIISKLVRLNFGKDCSCQVLLPGQPP